MTRPAALAVGLALAIAGCHELFPYARVDAPRASDGPPRDGSSVEHRRDASQNFEGPPIDVSRLELGRGDARVEARPPDLPRVEGGPWIDVTPDPNAIYTGVAGINQSIFLVGRDASSNAAVWESAGKSWLPPRGSYPGLLNAVAVAGSELCAVGAAGLIVSYGQGYGWTWQKMTGAPALTGVWGTTQTGSGAAVFLAVGSSGLVRITKGLPLQIPLPLVGQEKLLAIWGTSLAAVFVSSDAGTIRKLLYDPVGNKAILLQQVTLPSTLTGLPLGLSGTAQGELVVAAKGVAWYDANGTLLQPPFLLTQQLRAIHATGSLAYYAVGDANTVLNISPAPPATTVFNYSGLWPTGTSLYIVGQDVVWYRP